jgi:thiaminase
MTSQGPLTSWLLASTPQSFKRATTHPFLASAGQGTLPKSTLSQWLSQDRLYAQSYIRFIGFLLAKIRLPAQAYNPNPNLPQSTDAQAINVLIDALVNIRTELQFFEATAAEYNLDLTAIALEESGAGLTKSGSIATSAGISTMGSGSCPGFTGSACQGKGYSAAAVQSGEFEDDIQLPGRTTTRGPDLHRLCNEQGECQMQDWSQTCYPLAQQPSKEDMRAAPLSPTSAQCESGPQPTRGNSSSVAQVERGGTVHFGPTTITRAYIDMFMSSASSGVSVLEGMAVLWATEVCYLRSWKYAATFLQGREGPAEDDADGGSLRDKFIPNWSSKEFEGFVDRIGDVLDNMAEQTKGVEEAEGMRRRCLEWWKQVVWLEERFWPTLE